MMHEPLAESPLAKLRAGETTSADIAESVLEFYVDGDDDLIGLLAYGLYERQKRDWVVSHRRRHSGRNPSETELAAVTSNYLSADMRTTLRDRAAHVLSGYAETYVEALEPQIRISTLSSETLRQARELEDSVRKRVGFWRQVRSGFVVALLLTLVFAAMLVGAILFGADIVEAVRSLNGPAIRT